MSGKTKTIKINPELFSLKKDRNKSKKNNANTLKPNVVINQNQVKKRLLDRIKQHRVRNNNNNNNKVNTPTVSNDTKKDIDTNDFIDSLNYLTEKFNESKSNKANVKPRTKHNRTIRNPLNKPTPPSSPVINLELPTELKEPFVNPPKTPTQPNLYLKPYNSKNCAPPPYGCLKKGNKPTYRTWTQTRKNIPQSNIPQSNTIYPPNINVPFDINNSSSEREEKLKRIKEQFRTRNVQKPYTNETHINNPITTINKVNPPHELSIPTINLENAVEVNVESKPKPKFFKKITKKTITRKYTLGKSKTEKKISILIKDNKTRKQIIEANKEIRSEPIHEIKRYLKDRGLLKIGSLAPDNILRKMYETALLTGDITNKNKDTMLHNFLLDDEN